ncbi:MAG: helix-turn-helix transcriptional regulator, partial [Oscillospiraceae bacterium]
MTDIMIIGVKIQYYRKQFSMTQEELAKRLDLSVAFLSRVERGKSHISLKRLAELSQMLDVSISYLLEGSV